MSHGVQWGAPPQYSEYGTPYYEDQATQLPLPSNFNDEFSQIQLHLGSLNAHQNQLNDRIAHIDAERRQMISQHNELCNYCIALQQQENSNDETLQAVQRDLHEISGQLQSYEEELQSLQNQVAEIESQMKQYHSSLDAHIQEEVTRQLSEMQVAQAPSQMQYCVQERIRNIYRSTFDCKLELSDGSLWDLRKDAIIALHNWQTGDNVEITRNGATLTIYNFRFHNCNNNAWTSGNLLSAPNPTRYTDLREVDHTLF